MKEKEEIDSCDHKVVENKLDSSTKFEVWRFSESWESCLWSSSHLFPSIQFRHTISFSVHRCVLFSQLTLKHRIRVGKREFTPREFFSASLSSGGSQFSYMYSLYDVMTQQEMRWQNDSLEIRKGTTLAWLWQENWNGKLCPTELLIKWLKHMFLLERWWWQRKKETTTGRDARQRVNKDSGGEKMPKRMLWGHHFLICPTDFHFISSLLSSVSLSSLSL